MAMTPEQLAGLRAGILATRAPGYRPSDQMKAALRLLQAPRRRAARATSGKRPVLIIACGDKKFAAPEAGRWRAFQLYKGPLWQTFRVWRRGGRSAGKRAVWPGVTDDQPVSSVSTFVLSAKWGLVHERQPLDSYNETITSANRAALVAKVKRQVKVLRKRWAGREIVFVGPAHYYQILIDAGLTPSRLHQRGDTYGRWRKSLRTWLDQVALR